MTTSCSNGTAQHRHSPGCARQVPATDRGKPYLSQSEWKLMRVWSGITTSPKLSNLMIRKLCRTHRLPAHSVADMLTCRDAPHCRAARGSVERRSAAQRRPACQATWMQTSGAHDVAWSRRRAVHALATADRGGSRAVHGCVRGCKCLLLANRPAVPSMRGSLQ